MRAAAITKGLLALGLCLLCGSAVSLGNKTLRTVPYVYVPPTPVTSCPQGTGFPTDGCAAAPAPLTAQWRQPNAFQAGGYFNTTAGTTANYMASICGPLGTGSCRPPWNVAGVDFAIGNHTPIASLADPATMSVTGCTYSTSTSGTGGGLLTCGSGFTGTLQHINFGPVTGAGAHGCTAISITNAPASSLIYVNNIVNDTGLCSIGSNGIWINVSQGIGAGGVTFTNNYIDFNSSVWDTKIGGCGSAVQCNPDKIQLGANNVVFKYNVVRNSSGNPLTSSFGSSALTQTIQYNWIENWCSRGPNCHSEAFDGSGGNSPLSAATLGTLTLDHNVFLQGQTMSGFGPTMLWIASTYPFAISNGPNITNNTIVDAFAGGRVHNGPTFSGCWGGSFSAGVCGAPGGSNHLYVTSETSPVGYGADANCTGGDFVTYKSVPSPPAGAVEEYIVDGFSAFQYGPAFQISGSVVTCSGVGVVAGAGVSGNSAITATHGASPFGSPNYSNNYVDVSSFNGSPGSQQIWEIEQADSTVSVPSGTITTSLGVSTLNTSGVNVEYGAYVNGTGVDGCSSGIQGCPQIASGSAGTYTLSTAVTPVSTEAMTVVPWNWCANGAIVAGNVDMTDLMPLSWLNQLSGVTAGNGCGNLSTPALTPLVSSNFNPNQVAGLTNNYLAPAAGATNFPSTPTNSAAFYFEMQVNPALNYGFGTENPFANMLVSINSSAGQSNPGQPNFFFNRQWNGSVPGSWWWLNPGTTPFTGGSANAGSSLYAEGFFPFTAPASGCTRSPSGVLLGNTGTFQQTDPGFGCPTGTLSLNATQIAANVPNLAAQQTATSASCASGGAGILVTTSVPVSPGLSPGLTYIVNLTGTGGTSLNPATLTATSVTGSGPYTVVGTIAGTCPTGLAGTINSGTAASISFPAVSTTNPFQYGATGIATHNGQKICGLVVENGSDSNFPGSQAIAMVDSTGASLTGSPALVPFLNQGVTSNFTGSTTGSTNVLTISTIPPYTIIGATYNGATGYVTFTLSSSSVLVPGSEFNVLNVVTSPSSPNLFNGTYVAVAGTTGTTIIGEPLSGVAGIPQPFGSSPGAYSSAGSLYSVILPGQEIGGLSIFAIVMPYGTSGTTGTGGLGTYALSGTPAAFSGSTLNAYGGFYYTFSGTPRTQASLGDFFSSFGSSFGGSLGNVATLWGKIPTQAGGAPSVADLASICTKQTDIAAYAASKGITVHWLGRFNDLGIWGDSSIADFTGSVAGTALSVGSTQFGSLPTVTAGVPSITVSGAGITGCPASCPTISSGSGTSYVLSASGGTVASEPMKAGNFKPAVPGSPSTSTPNVGSTFKGYIDTTSGVSTLHVTSFDNGGTHAGFTSFTGSYNPSTSVLTDTGNIINSLPASGVVISDGGVNINGNPLILTGFISCSPSCTYNIGSNYYPAIASEPMWATSSSVVPGEYILNSAISTPTKVLGFQPATNACNTAIAGAYNGLLGCYTLSSNLGTIGSSGSPVVFTGTTITDGGAIAPGPALTITDLGPGTIFPVNFGTNTGTLTLSGTYNTTALGGTPSGIQVLVSNSAGGVPLTGCTPCNWGALTGTISAGKWTGTIAGIPAGGPYFVSVRATNGVAYATTAQSIRIGGIWAGWGNGQIQSYFSSSQFTGTQAGINTSWFSGLWGYTFSGNAFGVGNDPYVQGPPIIGDFVPGHAINVAGDRFGVVANGLEPVLTFDQKITDSLNVPASIFYAARDGIGMDIFTLGNVLQTQTVGVGDGSSTVWCSSSKFCTEPTGGVQTPLTFNAASLTGVWLNGSVSGSTLTVTTRYGGALEPGMVLGATGAPIVLRCLTSCTTPLAIDGSTWLLSSTSASGATGTLTSPLRADPPTSLIPFGGTTTPWPDLNIQPALPSNFGGFGQSMVKAGTPKFTDGTNSCTDTTPSAYNITGGNCTGTMGVSAWENYATGDYRVAFTTPPAVGAPIIATYTNIISPQTDNRAQNVDEMGDGTAQSGFVSSRFSRFPGGVSGQIWASQGTDKPFMFNASSPFHTGYPFGAPGYSEMNSWLFSTKFPALVPGYSASTPFLTTPVIRLERPGTFFTDLGDDVGTSQWAQDVATSSTFSGTVSGGVLTETTNAVGAIPWEGMVLDCVTVITACPLYAQSGVYITGLTGGAWGASGSTYSLANAGTTVVSPAAPLQNAVHFSGAGPALYLGALNDTQSFDGTHPGGGMAGGRRGTSRWAAMIYEASLNGGAAEDPKVDRVKADDSDCDAASLAAPCFVVATSHNASATASWSPTGNTVTITGGLAAHARPFVVGMNTFCSSCNSNLIITSVSAPPTQSTVAGQGQVGNTFSFTVANVSGQPIGGSGSGTFAGGCFGTSGTGSNCIDIPVSMTAGTALDTCGSDMLNGTASGVKAIPNGKCQGGQIGDLVRAFRIGTVQQMNGDGITGPAAGSVFDDGFDPAAGNFSQSSAFTCNIVAAKISECVKGPLYTAGVFAGVGQWSSGSTWIAYGDSIVVASRYGTLFGYVGGQSFPFTAGSGYTNGTTHPTVTCSGGGTAPIFDVTVAGGAITDVAPSGTGAAIGLNLVSTCSVALPAGGSGGAIPTITLAPKEGIGGVGDYTTDNNTMGEFLYDNSCLSTLSKFFTDSAGRCDEPGLPLRPFGMFQQLGVSG